MISSWKYNNRIFSYIDEQHIPEIVDILHYPEVEKYLWFAPITVDGFREFSLPIIEQQKAVFAEGQYPVSAIFIVVENGELLGSCGIDKIPDGHNVAMIGYQLKPSAWGKGIGTCCAEFVVHYAKTYLNLRKLFGDCVSDNIASTKVLEKCGFAYEGTIKGKYELDGKILDNSWYGLGVDDILPLPKGVVEELCE